MNHALDPLPNEQNLPEPIRVMRAESWQWEVLAKAFLTDDILNYWLGEKTDENVLKDFFEAVIKDALTSKGFIFSIPDQSVVFIWMRHAYNLEPPGEWKKRWYGILGPEGLKRYYSLYEAGDMQIDPALLEKSMLPEYIGILPASQSLGYGSYIGKWAFNYFDERGYESPYILASSRRAAKHYCPLLGFHVHKEVLLTEGEDGPAAIFLKRNEPGR